MTAIIKLKFTLYGLAGLIILGLAFGRGSNAFAQGARLIHNPPGSAEPGRSLLIEATVEGSVGLPISGRIYYRPEGSDAFTYIELRVERFNLTGEIPADALSDGELLYYLTAEIPDGASLTLPMGAPSSGELFHLPVRTPETAIIDGENAFTVLSPTPGAVASEGELVIAIGIQRHVRQVDLTALSIEYDGKDFTSNAVITEDLIVLPIPNVRAGSHSIGLFLKSDHGRESLLSWNFEGPIARKLKPQAGPISADVTAGMAYDDVNSLERRSAFLDARADGSYGKLNWAGRTYITSLESKYIQPQDRFLGVLEYGNASLKGGDIQPRFSEFSLWGVRTRGIEFAYKGSAFHIDVTQGELVRDVEGKSSRDTTIVVDPTSGDTLKSRVNPNADSVTVVNALNIAGRFRRDIIALRPGFPITERSTLSLNLVKVKDDINSIEWGRAPKDNFVLGFDFAYISKTRRFLLSSETALSLYNADITSGPMEDAKTVDQLIVINQYFDPLPTDSTILDGDLDQIKLAKKLFTELTKSALAHRTSLTLNMFRNEVKVGYKTIGRSFRSLGSPTILTDVAGFTIEDRLRLMNSRLYLTIGYESYADNVNGRSPTTTDRNIFRTGLSVYAPSNYPNFNLSYRTSNRENDGAYKVNHLPSGDSLVTDSRLKNTQSQYGFGLDESFRWLGYDNLIALSWNAANTTDSYSPAQATSLTGLSLNLNSKRVPWELKGSMGLTTQSAMDGALSVDYTNYSAGSRYNLLPDMLWLNAGLGVTMADGGNDEVQPRPANHINDPVVQRVLKVKYSRFEVNLGAEYRINVNHSLVFSAYTASQDEQGYSVTWDGVKTMNKNAGSYVDQNDTSLRLTYKLVL